MKPLSSEFLILFIYLFFLYGITGGKKNGEFFLPENSTNLKRRLLFFSLLNLQIHKFEDRGFPFKMVFKELLYDFFFFNRKVVNSKFDAMKGEKQISNISLKDFFFLKREKCLECMGVYVILKIRFKSCCRCRPATGAASWFVVPRCCGRSQLRNWRSWPN